MGRGNESLFVAYGSHAKPICMVKNLQKSSSPEQVDRFPQNVVSSIRDSGPS